MEIALEIGMIFSFLFVLMVQATSNEQEVSRSVNKARSTQTLRFSSDYVRCSCNLPQCVSTGYMCKSAAGGCFSHLYDVTTTDNHKKLSRFDSRHGCLELLTDKETRNVCEQPLSETDPHRKNNVTHRKNDSSLLFCCYHDMCNHMDSPQTKHLINRTLLTEESAVHKHSDESLPLDCTNSQVWFRAATIAVPLCGAVILFVLIAVAVKILRGENHNSTSRKLDTYFVTIAAKDGKKKQCPFEKVHQRPLLIQNELGSRKNDTNLRQELKEMNNKSVFLDIEKSFDADPADK